MPDARNPHLPNVRVGSQPEVSDGYENVGFRGQSGSRFRAAGCLLVAISGLKPLRNINRILTHRDAGGWEPSTASQAEVRKALTRRT